MYGLTEFSPLYSNAFCYFIIILDQEPQAELIAQLSQEYYSSNIFLALIDNISKLDFEVRVLTFEI